MRPRGRFLKGWIERIDLDTGAVEVLYDRTASGLLRGPNDIVFDAEGGFWFTDFGKVRARDMDRGSVCYARRDGSLVEEVIAPMVTPNGVGLSLDGAVLYVAETVTARVWRFDLAGPGRIAAREGPAHPNGGSLLFAPGEYQRLDSLAVDAEGYVCVATPFPGGIDVIDPEGRLAERILFPGEVVTNLCFGLGDDQVAYVTLSGTGRLVAIDWPRPGARLAF